MSHDHLTQPHKAFSLTEKIKSSRVMLLALLLLGVGIVILSSAPAWALNAPPVQIYYVTLPEADGLTALDTINNNANTPMYTYFSIAVGVDSTYVYYDQWEDGYAGDVANPTGAEIYNSTTNPAGVQIWGNGLAADGCAPNIAGVAVTCTNANDVLNAGDVIIPYNAVDVPRVPVAQSNVFDTFATQSYSRQDSNTNWSSNWVETGDDGSASAGTILINATSQHLRFRENTATNDSIDRGVNLSSGGGCATLSFDLGDNVGGNTTDTFAVQASSNGTTYTTLEEFDDGEGGSKSYNISGYASANTRVRFIALDPIENGEYWSIDNVRVTWNCSIPVLFDGKDKIGASSSIAMARATWASGSGTLNAFAHEMYPTAEWGTAYEAPVGTNTANAGEMFQYSALSIMAAQNNTTVQIDADANGSYETVVVLQEGGATLVPNIQQGARVISDKPVQVLQVTGDIGSNYASRDMNLLPTAAWGSSYWSPVGVVNGVFNTRLFLYNPSTNGSIYITCERYGVPNTTLGPVASKGVVTIDLVNGQGAHCFASTSGGVAVNSPIFAIGTVDTGNTAYDWSFTLFPDNFLTTDALVGLGLGKDPTNAGSTENGGPLWVTAACTTGGTYVYVDWDNDGIADGIDTNGDDAAEPGSQNGILVQRLQSVRLFEPGGDAEPYDQSGARVWSRTASGVGYGGTPGCNLALAWGQDPANASVASPGLDVGTSIFPLSLIEGTKSVAFANDIAPVGVLNEGDTIYYNITVYNAGTVQVNNVFVYDTVPLNTTYVLNSTEWNTTGVPPWTPIADVGGTLPLAQPGGVLLGNLAAGQTFYVRFRVTIQPGNFEDVTNCDAVSTSAGSFTNCVTVPVATRDWGDLPDSYGTSAAQNGPRHSISALRLGTLWDVEAQGVPTANASGDDIATSDDEDGVTRDLNDVWLAGATVDLNVIVTGGSGVLGGWFDWNNDGDIADAGEFINFGTLPAGNNVVPLTIPGNYTSGAPVYARFRLFAAGAIPGGSLDAADYLGFAAGGEVEDYLFSVEDPRLTIEKLGPTTAKPGVPFNYTINYANTGNVELTNVTIKDVLPHTAISDMKVLSVVSPPGVTCLPLNTINTTVTCTGLTNLAPAPGPGNTGQLVLQVEVVAANNNQDQLTNTACITGEHSAGTLGIAPTICAQTTTTTPVTLAYFKATATGDGTYFEWSTATETANAGFNLYVETPTGAELLNDTLIPSTAITSQEPQNYSFDAPGVNGGTFYLEDVGLFGENRFHGPFTAGEAFGQRVEMELIDWTAIAAENVQLTQQRTEAEVNNLALTTSMEGAAITAVQKAVELRVTKDGIYRVTYEQIKAAGVDLARVPKRQLQLTNRGATVPIFVSKLRFGPGAFIEFVGEGLDTMYTDTNVYRLEVNPGQGELAIVQSTRPPYGALRNTPAYYMETQTIDDNKAYSYVSPYSDPWYLMMLSTREPKAWNFPLQLDNYAAGAAPATLDVTFWGASEMVAGPDHRTLVSLNGHQVADEIFDRVDVVNVSEQLPDGVLVEGANTLTMASVFDQGATQDAVVLESYSVKYPRAFVARDGWLKFEGQALAFKVTNLPSKSVVVYRQEVSGRLVKLTGLVLTAGPNNTWDIAFRGVSTKATYYVSAVSAIGTPQVSAAREPIDMTGNVDLLVIAHPNFIDGLAPWVQARQADYTVKVVDVRDVYAGYSYGIVDAEAIARYIRSAILNQGVDYVALIGGDTYDYRNYLGKGSFSFIPSLYANTLGYITYAPVDPLFTDVNGDMVPDAAIGRFPVRTTAELDLLVNKTLQYDARASVQTAIFAADAGFETDSDAFSATLLNNGWTVGKAYLSQGGTGPAKTTLMAALNAGPRLASFVGHSGPTRWTFSGLFDASDAPNLQNVDQPTVITQWGCWNTYYVEPLYNTLGHKFLLSGMNGAAAVTGASTMTNASSERALGVLMMPRVMEQGTSLGAAMQEAKTELALNHPEMRDVLLGWSILGDPTVVVRP